MGAMTRPARSSMSGIELAFTTLEAFHSAVKCFGRETERRGRDELVKSAAVGISHVIMVEDLRAMNKIDL